jgi:hypothetical protein
MAPPKIHQIRVRDVVMVLQYVRTVASFLSIILSSPAHPFTNTSIT